MKPCDSVFDLRLLKMHGEVLKLVGDLPAGKADGLDREKMKSKRVIPQIGLSSTPISSYIGRRRAEKPGEFRPWINLDREGVRKT